MLYDCWNMSCLSSSIHLYYYILSDIKDKMDSYLKQILIPHIIAKKKLILIHRLFYISTVDIIYYRTIWRFIWSQFKKQFLSLHQKNDLILISNALWRTPLHSIFDFSIIDACWEFCSDVWSLSSLFSLKFLIWIL